LPVDLVFLGAEMMITAITFHRALAWTGVVFFVGAAIAVAWPNLAIAAMVGAGLGGTATLFWTLAD
jgi:hypothetical protein